MDNALTAAIEKTLSTVKRWARQKKPAAFVNHVDNRLAEQKEPFLARIADSVAVFSALKGASGEKIAQKVAQRWLEIVQKELNQALESTTAEELKEAISARTDQLTTEKTTLWGIIDENS